jgi:hypothetical protein
MNTKTRLAVSLANLPHGDYTFNSKIKNKFENVFQWTTATHCASAKKLSRNSLCKKLFDLIFL